MIFTVLGLALAGIVIAAIAFAPRGLVSDLPPQVDQIAPSDGATVLRQTGLEIDMQVDYSLEIFLDGVLIPQDEVGFAPATGVYTWRPHPGGVFEEWASGLHSVLIRWDRIRGLPDPGELRWRFRIQ